MAKVLNALHIRKEFTRGLPVLDDISLELGAGELVLLAGRNGSGKTVLSKILAGLVEASSGEIFFQSESLSSLKGSHASRIGYVFQDARLQAIGEKVIDDCLFGPSNLGLSKREAAERVEKALESCGLSAKRGDYVHTLSGGELRRLSLAGILAMDPAVVILDEPFANLDLDGIRSVLLIIKELKEGGKALLIATHELEKVLALSDHVIILDRGKMLISAPPREAAAMELEALGLRNPLRHARDIADLSWLD